MKFLRTALLVVLAGLVLMPVAASADTTGEILGTVRDADGTPLPGVTVTVTSPSLQGVRTATTDSSGEYRIPLLPPGQYNVAVTMSGFEGLTRESVVVALDQATRVNAELRLSGVTEAVTVTGEGITIDPTQTNTGKNFDTSYLRRVPVLPTTRTYQTVLQQAPGVTGAGNPNVLGGNILENIWLVDGVNASDSVTHTFSLNLNYDAIQEINLQTSSFDAEYGRASGGVVNVITKSGGNDFSGSLDVRFTSSDFSEKGDFFDPDIAPTESFPIAATLGGPILRDRLWFFVNTQHRDEFSTPVITNPVVIAQIQNPKRGEFLGWNSGGKLSFTVSPQFSGFASITDSTADIPVASAVQRPEATRIQIQDSRIYTLKLESVLTSNWYVNGQVGRHESALESTPSSGDLTVSQWTNIGGGSVTYDNYFNYQKSDRDRNLAGISTTYYAADLAGDHAFKVGADADKTFFPSVNITTGAPSDPSFCPAGLSCGATFTFRNFDSAGNRVPVQQFVNEQQAESERTGRSYAVYAQDDWNPISRLTLKLGVRWDRTEYYNSADANVLNFEKWQPRGGVVFDILGDNKNVFRANYGLFYTDAPLTLTRLFDVGVSAVSRRFDWSPTSQSWVFISQTGGNVITETLIDRPLKPTYDEQFNVAFERQLWRNAAASATYIYKKTHDIYEDSCLDAACSDFWVTNQPGGFLGVSDIATKNYYGYLFEIEQRFERGQLAASYVYSKSQGSIDSAGGQYAGTDFDHHPDHFVNRFGYLDDDARHRVKLFGSYLIPWIDTNIGINYFYRTGLPYTVTRPSPFGGTIFQERRGSHRTPVLHVLDASLEKQFPLFRDLSASVIGQVRNVLNDEVPLTYFTNAASTATVNTPASYSLPRSYQIGFRIDF
ncbi:MAG TPA: TonB-dependent receptor [Thermoanaerobaculia bacterium]|nr:TonB-dependent receptor [Thermoanaerobaculia bacterium]